MKRMIQLFWCWLAVGTIIWFIQIMVVANMRGTADPRSPVILLISAVLAGLATWLISRRNLEAWARWLGILFATLFFSLALAMFAFFSMVPVTGIMAHSVYWTLGAAFLVGIVAGVIISRKGAFRCLSLTAVVLLLTSGVVAFHVHRQNAVIKDYEQKWASMGWKMDLKDIFPMPYSKPQCDAWFNAIEVITPKPNEGKGKIKSEWEPFYDTAVVPLCSDKVADALGKGEDLKGLILSTPGVADPRWAQYQIVDATVREGMEQCPHVQWFKPEEYKSHLWDAPIPTLLGLMKWSRGLVAQANIAAANGRYEEARTNLSVIHRGAGKMLIPGQTLIGTLIGIAMERLSLVGEAGVMAMGGESLTLNQRVMLETVAIQKLDWFADSLKGELFASYSSLKNTGGSYDPISAGLLANNAIPFRRVLYGTLHSYEAENHLFRTTQVIQCVMEGIKGIPLKYGWTHCKALRPKDPAVDANLSNAYARALCLVAQARLVLMMDEVLKYRQDHKALPENLDFVQAPWRTDPFDEKPLRYKKEGDAKFVVWSVGPDGRDDGAQKLYVSGAMQMKDELKEDIGFRILLPPPGR